MQDDAAHEIKELTDALAAANPEKKIVYQMFTYFISYVVTAPDHTVSDKSGLRKVAGKMRFGNTQVSLARLLNDHDLIRAVEEQIADEWFTRQTQEGGAPVVGVKPVVTIINHQVIHVENYDSEAAKRRAAELMQDQQAKGEPS